MKTKTATITILVDNRGAPGLATEHGLSLHIRTAGQTVLFDTGQSDACTNNSRALGLDLSQLDAIVLSHGHYDHTGGLCSVLGLARRAELYCHPAAVSPRYAVRDHQPKPLHMPRPSMAALDRLPEERLHWVQQSMRLAGTIGLSGPIPRQTVFRGQTRCSPVVDQDGDGGHFRSHDASRRMHLPSARASGWPLARSSALR